MGGLGPAFSQKKILTGVIRDAHSEEVVPFASVSFKNTTVGKLSDSSGLFSFYLSAWPSDTLEITCVGYQPRRFYINPLKDSIQMNVIFERGTFNEGIRVRSKVNKGLFVWKKIVEHKPEHDRSRLDNFAYELDNKLELDLKNINFTKLLKLKVLKPIEDLLKENMDSSEGIKYLPVYFTEALSDYYFQNKPLKRREVIKGIKLTGKMDESVKKSMGGMNQIVNVYNNFIPVIDKQFVSPVSVNGDSYYNYRVADTQVVNNNRYYHLVFTPKHRGTNTFEGDCWVQVGSFAIQKMNLRLGKDANINFLETLSLIQEFKQINDSTWFLAKDKFVADITPVKNAAGFIGRKTTTYRNIRINDTSVIRELEKNKIAEEIIPLPGSDDRTTEFWDSTRHEELTRTERGVIRMMDTLSNSPRFQQLTKKLTFIGTGYLDVGKFQIGPWYNWISSNSWEGTRLRFDLGTNKKFNEKFRLHAYLAYGFKDKRFKGMGEIFYLPSKHPRTYLWAGIKDDMDYGQSNYGSVSQDNVFGLAFRKNNVPIKKIRINEKSFEFFRETLPWMSTLLVLTHRAWTPLRNLIPADSFKTTLPGNPLTTFEVSLRLRFAYLETFIESNFYRSSMGSAYPIGEFWFTRGIKGVFNSRYSYTKIYGNISDYFSIPPLGGISWSIYGGKTFGTLPYPMLDIAPGNELYYYSGSAFNMMNRWEFIHDKYAGISVEHHIGNGIFRLLPKLKWRQFWTVKTLWGSLSAANKKLNFKQGNTFQTLDGKTYMELGTGIDNIFHVFRIDFIWRPFPSTLSKEGDKSFGVFGSFRFSF
ncbi:MAG TPA: DUF5686 family protein [Chitinophagaceae bacterium]|nr:DUF5686 family protein [Chitinophagaceae bacterium]